MGTDISNEKLQLGLGLGLSVHGQSSKNYKKIEEQKQSQQSQRTKKEEDPCTNKASSYPLLTLGPPDDEEANNRTATKAESDECFHPHAASSNSPSAVSSFSNSSSIKRERDQFANEEIEIEVVKNVDENGNPRKKLRLTKEQSAVLEDSFKEHSTLNPKQKQELARKLNLRERQVEVWFQNRRARTKLKQTEMECETLKKCYETLTEENKRLQKELQEVKSMKATPPFYMQVPVASLSICPSCERISGGESNNSSSPTTALLIGSKANQQLYKTNCTFTSSSAAC